MVENVNINNKRAGKMSAAPTPHNTPSGTSAPNFGAKAPQVNTIDEGDENLDAIDGKLGSLLHLTSEGVSELPEAVQRRISGLRGLQKRYSDLESQFQKELFELEKAYAKKYAPIFKRRSEVVRGADEPTEEEIKKGEAADENEKKEPTSSESKKQEGGDDTKGIPEFWLTAMKNVLSLSEMITPEDEGALSHLVDIRISYMEKPGFKLEFEFAENPFFTNKILTKTYYYMEESGPSNVFLYDHAEGDKVDWKENADLTVRTVTKKQRNKNTKQTRVVKVSVPRDSFFNFFNPPTPPSEEDEESESPELDELLELDYQIGEDFKEKLIPRAVEWFTGEALALENYDGFSDLDVEEDEDDVESSSNEEVSDSDEEDSDSKHTAHGQQNAAECRQQ